VQSTPPLAKSNAACADLTFAVLSSSLQWRLLTVISARSYPDCGSPTYTFNGQGNPAHDIGKQGGQKEQPFV